MLWLVGMFPMFVDKTTSSPETRNSTRHETTAPAHLHISRFRAVRLIPRVKSGFLHFDWPYPSALQKGFVQSTSTE